MEAITEKKNDQKINIHEDIHKKMKILADQFNSLSYFKGTTNRLNFIEYYNINYSKNLNLLELNHPIISIKNNIFKSIGKHIKLIKKDKDIKQNDQIIQCIQYKFNLINFLIENINIVTSNDIEKKIIEILDKSIIQFGKNINRDILKTIIRVNQAIIQKFNNYILENITLDTQDNLKKKILDIFNDNAQEINNIYNIIFKKRYEVINMINSKYGEYVFSQEKIINCDGDVNYISEKIILKKHTRKFYLNPFSFNEKNLNNLQELDHEYNIISHVLTKAKKIVDRNKWITNIKINPFNSISIILAILPEDYEDFDKKQFFAI